MFEDGTKASTPALAFESDASVTYGATTISIMALSQN